jgi:hypothetical protein
MLEYADQRLCAHCGAPAARIGHEYVNDRGESVFADEPVLSTVVQTRDGQRPARGNDAGSVIVAVKNRTRGGDGFGANEEAVLGMRHGHVCARDLVYGGLSCGALTDASLTSAPGPMPDECYVVTPSDGTDAASAYRRLIRDLVERMKMA